MKINQKPSSEATIPAVFAGLGEPHTAGIAEGARPLGSHAPLRCVVGAALTARHALGACSSTIPQPDESTVRKCCTRMCQAMQLARRARSCQVSQCASITDMLPQRQNAHA